MTRKFVSGFLLALLGGALFSGCAKSSGVDIKSGAVSTTGATVSGGAVLGASATPQPSPQATPQATPQASAAPVDVTEFKICVAKIKLENENDEVEQKDGQEDIEFKPGLIDIVSGAKDWGSVDVPTGFKLKRLKIKVHRDPELCQGVPYSVKFNNFSTPEDVEFKFRFDPPIDLKKGDTLTLGFSNVVDTLRAAASKGTLVKGEDLKACVENLEDRGER